MRRRRLAVRPGARDDDQAADRRAVASDAGGAPVRQCAGAPAGIRNPSGGSQPRDRSARQAVHVRVVGRRGEAARHSGWRALPLRPMACRRQDARCRQRRIERRAPGRHREWRNDDAAVGHRARDRDARGALGPADCAHQSPPRGALRRRRGEDVQGRRSQRLRPLGRPRVVARRRMARVHVLDQRAAFGDQAVRRREPAQHARHAARIPRLQPGIRSRRQVPVLPVAAHVRSRLRQRAVRIEFSARGAALPDRAAGGSAPAVRAGAEGDEGR